MKLHALAGLFSLVLAGTSAHAASEEFNRDCRMAHREATLQTLDSIDQFTKRIDGANQAEKSQARRVLVTRVGSIDATLNSKRFACYLFEDASNKDCVRVYSAIYKEVRDRINLISLAIGNQEDVDLNLLDTMVFKGKLLYYDVRCK